MWLGVTRVRAGAYPRCHWVRGVVHPGQIAVYVLLGSISIKTFTASKWYLSHLNYPLNPHFKIMTPNVYHLCESYVCMSSSSVAPVQQAPSLRAIT